MAVIPGGATLFDVEAVVIGLAATDAVEAQSRDAFHVGGQQDAVPVDRSFVPVNRIRRQRIGHAQVDGGYFAPAQERCGQGTIDSAGRPGENGDIYGRLADGQVESVARQHVELDGTLVRRSGVYGEWSGV